MSLGNRKSWSFDIFFSATFRRAGPGKAPLHVTGTPILEVAIGSPKILIFFVSSPFGHRPRRKNTVYLQPLLRPHYSVKSYSTDVPPAPAST